MLRRRRGGSLRLPQPTSEQRRATRDDDVTHHATLITSAVALSDVPRVIASSTSFVGAVRRRRRARQHARSTPRYRACRARRRCTARSDRRRPAALRALRLHIVLGADDAGQHVPKRMLRVGILGLLLAEHRGQPRVVLRQLLERAAAQADRCGCRRRSTSAMRSPATSAATTVVPMPLRSGTLGALAGRSCGWRAARPWSAG